MLSMTIKIFIFLALSFSLGYAQLDTTKGGTSARTTAQARKNLFPDTTGHSLDFWSGKLKWQTVSGGGGSGLINWTDSLNTTSPNDVTNVAALLAKGSATNIDAVIQPKGNGALQRIIPDGTNFNKGGIFSVNWTGDFLDADNTYVASGQYATISGGYTNRASGNYSTVTGGGYSTADGIGSVSGGWNNRSVGDYSITSGGYGNTIVSGANYSSIIGGFHNTDSAQYSAIIGGGSFTLDGNVSLGFNAQVGFGGNGVFCKRDSTVDFNEASLWLSNTGGLPTSLVFFQGNLNAIIDTATIPHVGLRAPDTVTASVVYTLPPADGTAGQVLQTDGHGHLTWVNHFWDEAYLKKILY
jgi:hypothetical protein